MIKIDVFSQTIKLLLQYSDSDHTRNVTLLRFLGWQIYKRLIGSHWDIKLIPGVKLRCYKDSSSASSVIYYGLYEKSMMRFLLSYLREDDIFLDIGANIGVYSLLASSKILKGKIYSFEPIPKNYHRLKENIEINHIDNIYPYMLALYCSKGSIEMNISDNDCMASIIQEGNNQDNTILVETDTLNSMFSSEEMNISLCKLDAEGAELAILQGATHLLEKKSPPVFVIDYYTKDLADFMMSYGFSFYKYDEERCCLYPVKGNPKEDHASLAISKFCLEKVSARLAN
jgi:FkbM family methyltransferase